MKFLYLLLATAAVNAFAFVSPSNQRKNLPSVANKAELTRKNSNSNKGGHMDRPPLLDGSLAGDRGFDPLGFITSKEDLIWYREAEMKHARLAMLAAVGWPLSELWDRPLARFFNVEPAVDALNRAPSMFNREGFQNTSPLYWVGIALFMAFVEYHYSRVKGKPGYYPGNLGFDPLRFYPMDEGGRRRMQIAEIRNGRLAMLAITSFVLQEWVYKSAVVEITPWFFKPIWKWAESGQMLEPPPSVL